MNRWLRPAGGYVRISLLGLVGAAFAVLCALTGKAQTLVHDAPLADYARWQLSIALTNSQNYLKDGDGISAADAVSGLRLAAHYCLTGSLSVGLEAGRLQARQLPPVLLQRLTLSYAHVLGQYTFMPDSAYPIYLTAGLGTDYHRADLGPAPVHLSHRSLVYFLGVGQTFALYKSLYGFMEARIYWTHMPWNNFLFHEKRRRTELSAGLTLKL